MKLTLEFVLQLHDHQIETYGGTRGLRDQAGLESALAQPWLEVFGTETHPSVTLKAAAIVYHISRNHPFIDGNKRVAWACMETYLDAQGLSLEISDDDAYELINRVAQGQLEKTEIATYLEARLVSGAS